jgi:hypothetical protein
VIKASTYADYAEQHAPELGVITETSASSQGTTLTSSVEQQKTTLQMLWHTSMNVS